MCSTSTDYTATPEKGTSTCSFCTIINVQGRKSRRPPEDIERIVRTNVAQGLIGKDFRVTKMRGQWLESELAERTMGTIHPSAILRAPDPEVRERQYREFVGDLTLVAREIVH